MGDLKQLVLEPVPHVVPFAVSKTIQARVQVGHCSAEQGLQVMVPLGTYCGLVEVSNGGSELQSGVIKQVDAVIKSSLFELGEVSEPFPKASAVVGR